MSKNSRSCNEVLYDVQRAYNLTSCTSPSLMEVRRLLAHACEISVDDIFFNGDIAVTHEKEKIFLDYLRNALAGKPVSKIIGRKPFWKSEFITNEDVLDPRHDSETLIEAVLKNFTPDSRLKILDIGTGSGCLIISLLTEFKYSTGIAIDVSQRALDIAKVNSKNILSNDRLDFYKCDFLDSESVIDFLKQSKSEEKFDIIISNPPYIPTSEIESLDINVKDYDPFIALDGGLDGLKFYRKIYQLLPFILKGSGSIFLEIGFDQAEQVTEIFKHKFSEILVAKDLNYANRIIICKNFQETANFQLINP